MLGITPLERRIAMLVLGAFAPTDPSTAIVYLAAVVCFALAAFVAPAATRMPGGAIGLTALGLGLWLFPLMWNTVEVAF
jgi:hypothetical protein